MTETPLPSPSTTSPGAANPTPPSPEEQARFHEQYSRRIQTYTLISGLAVAIVAVGMQSLRWSAGIAVGTALAWLNFRWLDQGLGALVTAAQAQEGAPKPVVPVGLYAKFVGRYLLIGLTLYVIVKFFRVPILACLVGLLALGSGTIAAALQDVFSGNK
jgi:ATP synthase I chain